MPTTAPSPPTYFLDTNIFIRHLTNDNPQQSPACFRLIQDIEQGKVKAWTSDLVIAQVVFVLASTKLYGLSREAIRDLVLPLVQLPGIRLANKRIYPRVFELYTGLSINYTDAYNAALMENRKQTTVYSYDLDFDRVPSIERREP
jgi:predicted nucleic acid-binding protein